MKRAFTLVELIVVIGIIAILSGVLLATFGGSQESALAARCLSNMKNLGNAACSYMAASRCYPHASGGEYIETDTSRGMAQAKLTYVENQGWINWYSKGCYPATTSKKGSCRTVGLYSDDLDDVRYAIEQGSLYKYVGGNASCYVCPQHKKLMPNANWSYFMNPNIRYKRYGEKLTIAGRTVSPDRVLLLGEIPFRGLGDWFPSGTAGNSETDPAIDIDKENIGCNHKTGKFWCAHVAFCDGHVEKLRASTKAEQASGSNLRELTKWLCEGYDVTFMNGTFMKVSGADNSGN